MSKKKRPSEKVSSRSQDKAQTSAKPKPADKPPAKTGEVRVVAGAARKRAIFVKYDRKDGNIVAIHEIFPDANPTQGKPWTTIPKDKAAVKIALTDELIDKDLIYIHQNYKVILVERKPTLVPKG